MSLSNYTNITGEISLPNLFISNGIEFANGDVRLGNQAGSINQQSTAIAIGNNAGQNNQRIGAISIGTLAGVNNQQQDSIAIGELAGADNQQQEAVAIGRRAGNDFQGQGAVAVGDEAGDQSQGAYSVALGYQAGFALQDELSVAVGVLAGENSQGKNCVAVGDKAGQFSQGDNSVAVGANAGNTNQHTKTIILNATGNVLNSDRTDALFVAPVRNVASGNILYYNTSSKEVSYAPAPAVGVPSLETVLGQGNNADIFDIDMNNNDILNVNNINLSTINNSVYPPVAPVVVSPLVDVLNVGNQAGTNIDMSSNDLLKVGNLGFSQSSVSIGNGSGGKNDNNTKTNVGFECGKTSQSGLTVAIGNQSGNILQKASAVAIGNQAGRFNQGVGCVAIGDRAGDSGQGERAIAIGTEAGFLNQHTKTIILNATGSALNTTNTDSFYVAPIRSATNSNVLYYNTTNKEISYGLPPPSTPPTYSVVPFTPVLTGFSANTKTGYYQRIGNMVIGSITIFSNIQYVLTPTLITINLPVNGNTYNAPNLAPIGNFYYRLVGDTIPQRIGGIIYQRFPVANRMRLLASVGQNGAGTNLINMAPTNSPALELIDITFSYLCDD